MKWSTLATALCPLTALVQAIPSNELLEQRATSQYTFGLPKNDQFYVGPVTNLASYAPGAIIRKRQLPNNLTSLLPANIVAKVAATWQVIYRTNDVFGAPSISSATIWVPSSANADPNKILSYQPPWDSPNLNCVASYELQNGYLFSRAVVRELPANLIPISALNLGWYMVLPDHEQIIAAEGSGLTGAHATLDGIRAMLNSASFTGVSKTARIALSGYSGGAPPTEFAAEIKTAYAPELNIVGYAQGGINPDSLFQLNLAKLPDGQYQNILGQLLGLSNAYPNLTTYFNNNINAASKSTFNRQRYTCDSKTTVGTLQSNFKNPFNGVSDPIVQTVWTAGTRYLYRGVPSAPMYVNIGVKGPLSVKYPDSFVRQACARGAKITYVKNSKTNHNAESVFGNAGELYWLQDRLNGVPAASACTTINVATTTLAQSQKTLYGEPIYSAFATAAAKLQGGAQVIGH